MGVVISCNTYMQYLMAVRLLKVCFTHECAFLVLHRLRESQEYTIIPVVNSLPAGVFASTKCLSNSHNKKQSQINFIRML